MKAIILSRVSTFEQSLDAQTLDLQNDAKFNGYNKIIKGNKYGQKSSGFRTRQ